MIDVGIALPNTLDGPGTDIAAWARRAEERGFASLATLDRIVYPSYDALTTLAVAAGATSRIRLFTDILLAPLYPPVWLAKAAASLDAASGGRLTLGVGVGGRADDYAAVDRPMRRRGRLMDQTLDLLHRAWAGEPVAGGEFAVTPPLPGRRVPVLVGGTSDATVARTVRYGDGWTASGTTPQQAAPMVDWIRSAWRDAGRQGQPRFSMLVYFGLGDDDASRASLRQYYRFLGEWCDIVVDSAIRTPQAAKEAVRAYADVGATEIVFAPTVAALDEVDRLADAVL